MNRHAGRVRRLPVRSKTSSSHRADRCQPDGVSTHMVCMQHKLKTRRVCVHARLLELAHARLSVFTTPRARPRGRKRSQHAYPVGETRAEQSSCTTCAALRHGGGTWVLPEEPIGGPGPLAGCCRSGRPGEGRAESPEPGKSEETHLQQPAI